MTWDAQAVLLDYLKTDYGEYVVESPLEHHPMRQEFELEQGSVIAQFSHLCVIVGHDGAYIVVRA